LGSAAAAVKANLSRLGRGTGACAADLVRPSTRLTVGPAVREHSLARARVLPRGCAPGGVPTGCPLSRLLGARRARLAAHGRMNT
jgi:hypothetical protein